MRQTRSESSIEAAVREYAKSKGCLCFKFVSPGNPGVPDRIIIPPNGRVMFLELKAPGKQPRSLQWFRIKQLRGHNCRAEYADSVEAAKLLIDSLL